MPGDADGSVNKLSVLMITVIFAKKEKSVVVFRHALEGQIKILLYVAVLFREYRVKTRGEMPCMCLRIRAKL